MALFKDLGLLAQGLFVGQIVAIQKLLSVVVIEFLYHAVSPRFPWRNKPELNAMMQTKPNQTTHAPRMSRTAVEDHVVIDLEMVGDSQSLPDSPYRIDSMLSTPLDHGFERTSTTGQIDAIETVKAGGTAKITGTHKIQLMDTIHAGTFQARIGFAFGLIAFSPALDQSLTTQNAIDRPHRG